MHGAQPVRPAARKNGFGAIGRCCVAGRLAVRLVLGRTRDATTTAPTPAPTWFALFAVRHPSDSSWHGHGLQDILAAWTVPGGAARS